MRIGTGVAIVALSIAPSCGGAPSSPKPMTREEAIAVARNISRPTIPKLSGKARIWGVWEEKKVWVIKWVADPEALGGAVTVVVDKNTREVLAAWAEQ